MNKQNMRGFPKNGARSNVPTREYKTSGTNQEWPIPAGVTAFTIYVIGGGGGGAIGGSTGSNGTASTVTYNSVVYTGSPGIGGPSTNFAQGGGAINGDLNVEGSDGSGESAASFGISSGGTAAMFGGGSYGAGGYGRADSGGTGGRSGSGAGLCIKRIAVIPGQKSVAYTVGVGGAGASSNDGKPGIVIFEY